MAKKQAKAEPVHEAAKPKIKEDPGVVFTKFLTSCTEQQRKTIFAVDATLKLIQTDKKKLRRELQPLRVGMELSKVREIIVGRSGKANPQQESGRIWGDYRDSHLKAAGYTKSSADTYVGMIEEARKILPDDTLIAALIDFTNEKGAVVMTGGSKEKPFGKFTDYLKSDAVQMHIKDGQVDLDDLSADELIVHVFDPTNVETPDTPENTTVAVNTAVRRIWNEVKKKLPKATAENPIDEAVAIKLSHEKLRYVIEALLTACEMEPISLKPLLPQTFNDDDLISLSDLVTKANEKLQKAAEEKRASQRESPEPETEPEIRHGKYTIHKNRKAQHFPQTPWEIWEDGKKKPTVRCQDKLQAETEVSRLLNNEAVEKAAEKLIPEHPATDVTGMQDAAIRKQRESQSGTTKQYDAG